MALKFGTSGVRGLAVELDETTVASYVRAFLSTGDLGTGLYIAHDRRASSPEIAASVRDTGLQAGIDVTDCGAVATPALAMAAAKAGAACIMVTGSHIPADRNGLKFYRPSGEISKADEEAITAALHRSGPASSVPGKLYERRDLGTLWGARFQDSLGDKVLSGMRVGVWGHSAVCRDDLVAALAGLGAETVKLDWRDEFVAVDTEAVDDDTRTMLAGWCRDHQLDALVSTDGDGDRPMLADARGQIVPGDILGQITARWAGAKTVVTPVSSNSGVTLLGFDTVTRTKIGSPYVIAAMESAQDQVFGYEANGGALLGFSAQPDGAEAPIAPLWTRDSLLPIVAMLSEARDAGIAARVAKEPARFTASGRLQDIPPETSGAWLQNLIEDKAARESFLAGLDQQETGHDLTDGLRMTLTGGDVLHLRPSGNAPEFRVYTEAANSARAAKINADTVQFLVKIFSE